MECSRLTGDQIGPVKVNFAFFLVKVGIDPLGAISFSESLVLKYDLILWLT
jgi:hypothetical protein